MALNVQSEHKVYSKDTMPIPSHKPEHKVFLKDTMPIRVINLFYVVEDSFWVVFDREGFTETASREKKIISSAAPAEINLAVPGAEAGASFGWQLGRNNLKKIYQNFVILGPMASFCVRKWTIGDELVNLQVPHEPGSFHNLDTQEVRDIKGIGIIYSGLVALA